MGKFVHATFEIRNEGTDYTDYWGHNDCGSVGRNVRLIGVVLVVRVVSMLAEKLLQSARAT